MRAIAAARAETARPSLIAVRTHIGYGSPNKQDTLEAHGSPLGEDEVRLTKERLGWPATEPFHVPDEALAFFARRPRARRRAAGRLDIAFRRVWRGASPRRRGELAADVARRAAAGLGSGAPHVRRRATRAIATRNASGKVLNAIAPRRAATSWAAPPTSAAPTKTDT